MTWVLIDASYLAYQALYTTGNLSVEDVPTGVIFGFLQQLRTVCELPRIRSNKVAVFFDSRKSFRRDVYPQYKGKRRQNETEEDREKRSVMRDQLTILRRELLPGIGVPCYRQKGLESDDLIAQAALQIDDHHGQGGVMVTGDGDLYQCITDLVHWTNPNGGTYYSPGSFEWAKRIPPHRWWEVKAIAGCSTDNVEGVPGVGELTAIQYLRGELPIHYQRAKAIVSGDGREIVRRNESLVRLPHLRTHPFTLQEPKYDPDAFFRYCERYGFRTFLGEGRRAWERFFDGPRRLRLRRRNRG